MEVELPRNGQHATYPCVMEYADLLRPRVHQYYTTNPQKLSMQFHGLRTIKCSGRTDGTEITAGSRNHGIVVAEEAVPFDIWKR